MEKDRTVGSARRRVVEKQTRLFIHNLIVASHSPITYILKHIFYCWTMVCEWGQIVD